MNTTTYKKRAISPTHPAQVAHEKAFDLRNERHPARTEINKCIGTYNLKAVVEEDVQTLTVMRDTPGVISFLCSLVNKDGRVIAQGHGSSILNQKSRYIERAIHSAFNSSLADAVIRATKVLDTFRTLEESGTAIEEAYQMKGNGDSEPATEKQQEYLRQLIQVNVVDETEREQLMASLSEITKQEASEKISEYKS